MDLLNDQRIGHVDRSRTAEELCHYVHYIACTRSGIPRFFKRATPLYTLLNAACKKLRKLTKRATNNPHLYNQGLENSLSIGHARL